MVFRVRICLAAMRLRNAVFSGVWMPVTHNRSAEIARGFTCAQSAVCAMFAPAHAPARYFQPSALTRCRFSRRLLAVQSSCLLPGVREEGRRWKTIARSWKGLAGVYRCHELKESQERKQHHVHISNEESKEREPLQGCRREDNPRFSEADYPRTLWLIERFVVLCHHIAKEMDMAILVDVANLEVCMAQ
jgi:hypothetical protein